MIPAVAAANTVLTMEFQVSGQDLLTDNFVARAPVHNSAFLPGRNSRPAHHHFSGTLHIHDGIMQTRPATLRKRMVLGKDIKRFPDATLDFMTYQGVLLPGTQEVIRIGSLPGSRSYWDLLLAPGLVWSEPDDGDWSRASFPFSLVNTLENETHHGVATFLYNNDSVSALRFQIVQQTTPYLVTDEFAAWGQLTLELERKTLAAASTIKSVFHQEQEHRFPSAPWSVLAARYGDKLLDTFDAPAGPARILASGLVFRGVLYTRRCPTPYGELPFCDNVRFGLWSVTKSTGNALAMLRLAEKYGVRVFDLKLVDYVDELRSNPGYTNVTFGDALNMATGIGSGSVRRDVNNVSAGSRAGKYDAWYRAPSAAGKIRLAAKAPDLPRGPGEVVHYRDQDMFLLGVAMNRYLKQRQGPQADIWDMLRKEVFAPIHVYHAPVNRTIEKDGHRGQPLMAWGHYANLDELAKIAHLLHRRGIYDGRQILHAGKIAELFYETRVRGLPHDQAVDGVSRYHMSFRYAPIRVADDCLLDPPTMVGRGGNIIMLLPKRITAIRISRVPGTTDSGYSTYNVTAMARIANYLGNLCN